MKNEKWPLEVKRKTMFFFQRSVFHFQNWKKVMLCSAIPVGSDFACGQPTRNILVSLSRQRFLKWLCWDRPWRVRLSHKLLPPILSGIYTPRYHLLSDLENRIKEVDWKIGSFSGLAVLASGVNPSSALRSTADVDLGTWWALLHVDQAKVSVSKQ